MSNWHKLAPKAIDVILLVMLLHKNSIRVLILPQVDIMLLWISPFLVYPFFPDPLIYLQGELSEWTEERPTPTLPTRTSNVEVIFLLVMLMQVKIMSYNSIQDENVKARANIWGSNHFVVLYSKYINDLDILKISPLTNFKPHFKISLTPDYLLPMEFSCFQFLQFSFLLWGYCWPKTRNCYKRRNQSL